MLVGVASKIKRLSSAQVWRSSVSELLVVTPSAPVERIDVFLVEYVIFQSCSSSGEACKIYIFLVQQLVGQLCTPISDKRKGTSSVSELLVDTASAPLEKIDVFLVEYVIFQSCSSSGEARRDIEIPRD